MRMPNGPAPALDPKLYCEPSGPHYPLVGHTWVTFRPDWFAELGAFDASRPWRVWWLTQPAEHPYNTYFRPNHREFLVFVPAGVAESDVVSRIVEDVDPNEPAPPTGIFVALLRIVLTRRFSLPRSPSVQLRDSTSLWIMPPASNLRSYPGR